MEDEDVRDLDIDGVKPVRYLEVLKEKIAYCPSCKSRYERSVNEVLLLEGPIYSKKDVGDGVFNPMIKLSIGYECSACRRFSAKKSILLPLSASEILQYVFKEEIVENIEKVKEKSKLIESIIGEVLN